jgi:hypothetical protein
MEFIANMSQNGKFAAASLIVAIAMGIWFTTEAVKDKKENGKFYTAMVMMILFAVSAIYFSLGSMKNMRNGYMPAAINMPSNAAGGANVPAPGAPMPLVATNAAANKVV